MFGTRIHRYLYIFFLSGIAFSLPSSIFLTSVFTIALVSNWVLDRETYRNLLKLTKKKSLLAFLIIYLLYLLYMINTSDRDAGLSTLRLKLPLLAIPLVAGTGKKVSELEERIILTSFLLGVLFASVAGTINYFILSDEISDRRDISLYISHIRLSLMVCFSVFISSYYTLVHDKVDFRFKYVYALFAFWFVVFLLILMSFTGIIIFLAVLFYSSFILAGSTGRKGFRRLNMILTLLAITVLLAFLGYKVRDFYNIKAGQDIDYSERTLCGNTYKHYPDRSYLENGYYVWRYICENELRNEWNRRSKLDYDGVDLKGQDIERTIIRYMSSLGLRKDSASVALLDLRDIDMIEAGYANCRYKDGVSPGDRIYELIWQLDYYFKGGNPQGHSLTQRIEFFITGVRIFKRHPLFGTGTGDLVNEFKQQYRNDRSRLDDEHRFISHNQYLTELIRFGLPGLVFFIFALIYPVIKTGRRNNYLFTVFFIIVLLSMLNEDTLETHTGITFFSFFYSLLLFGTENKRDTDDRPKHTWQ